MANPFFSVVIPTYNQATFLKRALESVFEQKYKNFEVIVIDNYSKDNTDKLIKKYKKKIIYKKISNKGIIAKSRNLGIKLAKGKWIAFLDSDDCWAPNKLETIYSYTKNILLDVVCHSEWVSYLGKKNFKLWTYGPYKKNFYEILIKQGSKFSTSASVVKKSFLNKNKILFDEKKDYVSSEDYSFFMNVARKKANFFFINKPLGFHLFHNTSVSSNLFKHFKSQQSVIKNHIFNVQEFTKNKKKLWLQAKSFLELKIIFFNLGKDNRFSQLKKIIIFFIYKPLFTINYLHNLLIKKLKDHFFYLLYASELKKVNFKSKLGTLAQ